MNADHAPKKNGNEKTTDELAPYEPPTVESVQLSDEAAESLT